MDWAGWFAPRFRRREPLDSLAPPAEEDLEQLASLRAAGSRLDLPHPVRSFLIFDEEAGARGLMEALDREAFRCQLRIERGGRWTVTAVKTVVPTPGAVTRLRETLSALAADHGGRYVAWSAPPIY